MTENTYNALKLHAEDNVVIALRNVRAGEVLSVQGNQSDIKIQENIPYGHKIAAVLIPTEGKILKYGEWMGVATKEIEAGHHVHINNVRGLNEEERISVHNSGQERSSHENI